MGFGIDEDFDEADFYCEECQRYVCECAEEIETGEKMTDEQRIEKLRDIDQDEWHGETLAIRHAEKYWGPREDLEEEEQNNFDAERDAFRAGWEAARANPDPRVRELVEAARQVEEWFDISNLDMVVVKRGPGDLISNDNMAAWAIIRVIEALRKFERGGT